MLAITRNVTRVTRNVTCVTRTLHALHERYTRFFWGLGIFSSSARTLELYIYHARLSVPFYDTEMYVLFYFIDHNLS